MPIATIPRGLTTVYVNQDSLGVEENARVSVTCRNILLAKKPNSTGQTLKRLAPYMLLFF